jgi:hypothetical protein
VVTGHDLADGFLFGVVISAASGSLSYWGGMEVAGAWAGKWGIILGKTPQGAIVGLGDGLIQSIAAGKGVLEVIESMF